MNESYKTILNAITGNKPANEGISNNDISSIHRDSTSSLRAMISCIMDLYAAQILGQMPRNESLWGEKETPVIVLSKIVPIFLKVIEAEKRTHNSSQSSSNDGMGISQEDLVIIKEYLQRIVERHPI